MAQLTMIPMALLAARLAEKRGYGSVSLFALFSGTDNIGMLCASAVSVCWRMAATIRKRVGDLILPYRNVS